VIAILAALRHRDATGEGQTIDLALLDVQVACLANQAANYLIGGVVPQRMGNAHPNIAPYQDFPTADGHLMLAVGNDAQFRRFCETAGQAQWADDPRFATNPLRVRHRAELIPLIAEATRTRPTQRWIEDLERAGVPCGPINALDAVFADPQVLARGLRVDVDGVPLVASPLRLSATPVSYRRRPPRVGADQAEVMADWLDGA